MEVEYETGLGTLDRFFRDALEEQRGKWLKASFEIKLDGEHLYLRDTYIRSDWEMGKPRIVIDVPE